MKKYKATWFYRNGKIEQIGTIAELVQSFSYKLMCGNSWDMSINRNPKTARGLENALNKSAVACRNYYDSYVVEELPKEVSR